VARKRISRKEEWKLIGKDKWGAGGKSNKKRKKGG
jgi:hypothetical protein